MRFYFLRTSYLRMAILLVMALIGVTAVVQAATSGPVQNISKDATDSLQSRVAQDPDGNIHTVWVNDEGGARTIRYAKGTWNGTAYAFSPSALLADVGSYQYSLPNVAVAPNGMIMVAWGNGNIHLRTWSSRDNQPGGGVNQISAGIQPSIAVDSASRFHIIWNGDSKPQYCQWEGASCTKRDTLSDDVGNRPDIAVDSNNGVHAVWDGGGVKYRSRAAGANWGTIQSVSPGIKAQIAADRQGTVHLVYSNDYNIQYCRRALTGGCTEQFTIDAGNDLDPSIGATPAGSIIVGFRDATSGLVRYATRENGAWTGSKEVSSGITPDVAQQLYVERTSIVWSRDYEIQHVLISLGPPPAPSPTPVPPTPTPVPPKFTGSLVVNDGAEVTTNPQVNVTINNTSAEVPSSYSLADDIEPGTPSTPFTNASTTTSFTLDVADGRCRIHKVNAKLGSSTGTSETFSDNILFDPSADALIIARNPNLPTNPEINQFFSASLPSGDVAFTRRKDFNASISRGPNECSNLTRYAFVKHGKALTDADWRNMPAEGYVSAYTTFTPNLPGAEGAYQFDGYVEDSVGHKTTNPYVVTIVYDVTGPTVSGASGALTTTPSPKGGIAEIDTSGLAIDDNLYTDPSNTRKYWGYWIAVKKTDAGAPTEDEWAQFGFVKGGLMSSPLGWNVSRGIVGGINNFTPGQHTIYIRYLDGAGNWSNTVTSHSIQVNQLELLTRLPMLSR